MKCVKIFAVILLLQSSVSISSVPYNYSGNNNPIFEMFLIMMDMFGMTNYNKNTNISPYSSMSPFNYGAMSGMGMSPMSGLGMPGLSPLSGASMMSQGNQFSPSMLNTNPINKLIPINSAIACYKSPLEGVWLGGNGDTLVFMGEKFYYATSATNHLTGNARIVDNKIIADIDDSEEIIKFFFEIKNTYLAVKIKKEILYFKKQI